ncbi:uncharacterized protein EKO05_0005245 [Ascochyta rabiei]|uniref:Uncharacterized protein n=1 Tax=Didymella rabiei TaxID=5454 RepID=A0A163L3I8_DIDRA|nr:uncharacterized protein EKO05_0005245 [Ascochyta rabiei]KZM27475.1 hypothetical protein ST47_g1381 [Ascochyta rabiei]UPX14773.1 hypothetical protein EKO05_0005245 [Ascochyta rabiei]
MYIIQTTTAVLIAFLALLAWDEVRNRLSKGRTRNKDPEAPDSPRRLSFRGWRFKVVEKSPEVVVTKGKPLVPKPTVEIPSVADVNELWTYKRLYHKLHNLEHHFEILPECRELLLSFLSSTLDDALRDPDSGILSVKEFSREELHQFLKEKDFGVTNRWEEYLARRRAGGSREVFGDMEEAKWWLKQAAPVKYVDGAWLGHINKITTPFKYRNITKNAWQVMSEELGDGDLAKNHVYVYRQLMDDIDAGLPAADSEDFIDSCHNLDQTRCWKAAVAQLLISLFPHDFLPESLGFNMAYESLPLHLLKTVKELREVRLNPYYFELHISIDNADSGHAAMAMAAVADYIDRIEQDEGAAAAKVAWKRVQAGYVLAEGLPTTPESPSLKVEAEETFPRTETEAALLNIFAAKAFVAHKIHCNSRLKIGRRSLVDWLEPEAFTDKQWQREFIYDLGSCKPWVVKGESENSRLVKELSWEGKMFGSFTQTEVEVVKTWIDNLGSPVQTPQTDPRVYFDFTKQPSEPSETVIPVKPDIFVDYPVSSTLTLSSLDFAHEGFDFKALELTTDKVNLLDLLPLWFTSPALLESLPSVPVRAADAFGSALVRVLRAQTGFDVEGLGVAGMDEVHRTGSGQASGIVELGLEICRRADICVPATLKDIVGSSNAESVAFARWMMSLSTHWLTHCDVLIGMSWAFMELHELIAGLELENSILSPESAQVLQGIARRERAGLEACERDISESEQRKRDFERGLATANRAIRRFSI